jgi:hypothetical protein
MVIRIFRKTRRTKAAQRSARYFYAGLSGGGGSSNVSGARLSGAVGGSWTNPGVMSLGIAAAAVLTC